MLFLIECLSLFVLNFADVDQAHFIDHTTTQAPVQIEKRSGVKVGQKSTLFCTISSYSGISIYLSP